MNPREGVVSGCRKVNLLACLTVIVAIALFAAYADLTSQGLKRTQLFLAIGYGIYPLFYGACIFSIWKLANFYRRADTFIALDETNLFVWSKRIPLREVSSISVRSGLLFPSLIIAQTNGPEIKVSSVALTKSIDDVAERLKVAAGVN